MGSVFTPRFGATFRDQLIDHAAVGWSLLTQFASHAFQHLIPPLDYQPIGFEMRGQCFTGNDLQLSPNLGRYDDPALGTDTKRDGG